MFHLICSLRFPDGQVVAAQLNATTQIEDAPVAYSGPIKRLPISPPTANAVELRAYFASFARELGARLTEDLAEEQVVLSPEIDGLLDRLKHVAGKAGKTHRLRPVRS